MLSPKKAPSMKNDPCARLTTFIKPKMSDKPAAMRNSSTPKTSPLRSWARISSINDPPAARRPRQSIYLLPGVLHLFGGVKNHAGDFSVALDHLADMDVLDRIVRFRVEPEWATRRVEFDLDHRLGQFVFRGVAVGRLQCLRNCLTGNVAIVGKIVRQRVEFRLIRGDEALAFRIGHGRDIGRGGNDT